MIGDFRFLARFQLFVVFNYFAMAQEIYLEFIQILTFISTQHSVC